MSGMVQILLYTQHTYTHLNTHKIAVGKGLLLYFFYRSGN